MKAVDTNVLVRFLVRDDERQADAVYRLLKRCEAERQALWVPLLVLLETIWVLESAYSVPRSDVLDAIDDLLLMPTLAFEAPDTVRAVGSAGRETTTDLADLLIAHSAKRSGCEAVLTFDRKAAASEPFELLERDTDLSS